MSGGSPRPQRRRTPVLRLASVLLFLRATTAPADETPAPQGPVEKVEVRGETEETAPLDATAFATVLRAEDFAGRITTVPELLRQVVGVQVRGFGGEYATVSIRGSSAEQVVVYIDGVPLNRALGGAVNLADLPLAQVESIEVYRGFTPAGLPAASIGGAVMIHTRRPGPPSGAGEEAPEARLSASAGSYGSLETIASLGGRRGRGDYALGFDGGAGSGDYRFPDDNGTPHNPSDDSTPRRVNNDFRRGHVTGSLTLKSPGRARFSLMGDALRRDQGVPGLDCCLSPDARYTTTRWLLRPELEVPGLLGGRLLARVAADYTRFSEEFDDRHGAISLSGVPIDSRDDTSSLGAETGLVLAARRQAVSFLASRRRETADLRDGALPGPDDIGRGTRDTTVLSLEDQMVFAADRLVINPSLRREVSGSDFRPGAAGGLVGRPRDSRDTTGKIGFRLRAGDAFSVKGNYGRFVRLPDLTELFGNRGSVIGNSSLAPERGRSVDLGLVAVHRRTKGPVRLVQAEGTLFETLSEDLIQFLPNSQSTVQALNLARARVRGIELSVLLGLASGWSAGLNVTHQDPRDLSGDPDDGRILPGRPRDEIGADVSWSIDRARLFYEFTYVGPNFIDRPDTASEALPSRYLSDAGCSLRLRPGLLATLEVKNLADRQTFDYARYPLPGRSVQARLSWEF